jgi:hypothetical protein
MHVSNFGKIVGVVVSERGRVTSEAMEAKRHYDDSKPPNFGILLDYASSHSRPTSIKGRLLSNVKSLDSADDAPPPPHSHTAIPTVQK